MSFLPRHQHRITVLGEILAGIRQSKRITTEQVAERLDKPESFVLDYESGKYRLDLPKLIDIADALGIDVIELVNVYQQNI